MRVQDVMTREAITVAPDASIHEAARLMVDHGVSGLPVVDDTGLVGIISEGDLIVHQKPRTQPPWWHLFVRDGERLAREYQKAVGMTVGEVMSRPVICARPEMSLAAAAALLDEHRIRRLPVVSEGELVGIVSRADLIKALAVAPPLDATALSDAQLASEMTKRMSQEAWVSSRGILIDAHEGVVSLWGLVESDAEKSALETMARTLPGARGVNSQLMIRAQVLARYAAV